MFEVGKIYRVNYGYGVESVVCIRILDKARGLALCEFCDNRAQFTSFYSCDIVAT